MRSELFANNVVAVVEEGQAERLMEAEGRIRRSWVEGGKALGEIRDGGLYRVKVSSWEEYLGEVWGMSLAYANRLILGARQAEKLAPAGAEPATESSVRPVLRLPEEKRADAWKEAVDRSGGAAPTARTVADVVNEIKSDDGWVDEGPEVEEALDPNVTYPIRGKLSPACQILFDKEVVVWNHVKDERDRIRQRAEAVGIRGLNGPVSNATKLYVRIPHPNGGSIRGEGKHENGWLACVDCVQDGLSTGTVHRQKCPACGGYGFHVPNARYGRDKPL